MSFTLGYMILLLWICKKSFFFHCFPSNQSSSVNESNPDSYNNLYSFLWLGTTIMFSTLEYMILIGFVRNAFLSTIFFIVKVHPWNESNFDSHSNLHFFFVCGTTIMFSTLGYMILMLGICKKNFSFHHFPYN